MAATPFYTNSTFRYFTISLIVLLSCLGLFYLDRETKTFSDLLTPGNLVALLIYFLPTYSICVILYHYFKRKLPEGKSIIWSAIIGIPIGFLIVIGLLILLKQ